MTTRSVLGGFCGLMLALTTQTGLGNPALTGMIRHENICISFPWAYESLGKNVSAVFMGISIAEGAKDALVGADYNQAKHTHLHDMIYEDGVMTMNMAMSFDLNFDTPIQLKPHGKHIMLMGMKEPLEPDSVIPLTLKFRTAGEVQVKVPVISIQAEPPTPKLACE